MKQKLLFLLALAFVSISAMGQVTFTAIGGSDFDDGEGSKMACDGNINTKWCKRGNDNVDNCYLVVKASEATYIEGFSMTTGNDSETYRGRAPRDYTIFGSDNNTDWDVIYHQQDDNLIEDENFKTYTVYCNSKKMYKYFKLWIKASHNTKGKKGNDGRVFQISEFVLLPATQGMTLMSGDAKAMDGETGQKWEGNVPRNVVVKASLKCFLKGYQFTTGNDNAEHHGRNPKDWKVEGSNDQTNWTVLDTETGNTVMEDKNCYPYFFEVTSASVGYQYFRFTVSGAADGTYFQISELALKAEVAHEHNYVDGYCTICHRPDPAYMTVNTEGFYELGTAAQMKWWSAMVGDGHAGIKAKLTADIDLGEDIVMVGTERHKYAGTFDGQGHTLTVNIVGTGQGTAPFHRTNGATIRNLTIAGTITAPANTDNYHTAGLVGFCENTTLQRCVVKAAIHIGKRYDQYSGGLIGHILSGNTTIEDCAFIGSIRGDDGYISNIAGLVAWGDDGTLTIRNSYVNATYTYVSGLNAILCRDKGSQNNLSHVYYSERSKGIAQDNNMNGNLGEQITNEQVKNGFLAYHLQAGRTDQVWGQTIGTDDEPLFTSDAAKHVYQVTFAYNDKKAFRYANYGNPIAGGLPIARDILGASYNPYNSYTLTFADGFDATTTVTADRTVKVQMAIVENGYFAVSSKADWKELCDLVNGGETGLNAKLTKDVDLGTDIVILGTVHQQYSGTFDGQDHTLSFNWDADRGSYIAPFRNVNNATIQNLRTKGRIMTGGDYLSGLVMEANGTTTISRCVTDVDITGGHHSIPPYIAGMVTNVENGASVIITDCLVKGSITDASWFAGKRISGFVGGYKGTRTITNCLYLGTSKYGEYYTFTFDNNATLNNCYYLNTCGEAQGTPVTAEQLRNGYVAYKLQAGRGEYTIWGQDLDSDAQPMPTNAPLKMVYEVKFSYKGQVRTTRYANKGKGIYGTLPTAKEILGSNFNPQDTYNFTFSGKFTTSTPITADRTVIVTILINNCYMIGSKEEWKEFCELVKDGQTNLDAKMTADINLGRDIAMVGNNEYSYAIVGFGRPYTGTFDGQGHTLNVSWYPKEGYKIAPFQSVNNATIKNLCVTGNINSEMDRGIFGGLISNADGNTTITNCITDMYLTVKDGNVGGMVSEILGGSLTMTNCVTNGVITLDNKGYGAGMICSGYNASITMTDCLVKVFFRPLSDWTRFTMSGFIYSLDYKNEPTTKPVTLNNCLYLGWGKVTQLHGPLRTFAPEKYTTLNNCYHLNKCGETPQGTQVTEKQLKSGEITKLLQNNRTDVCHWAQVLGEMPNLYHAPDKSRTNYVYYDAANSRWTCEDFRLTDGTPLPIGLDFLATKATYERTLSSKNNATVCLPYELPRNGSFTAYNLSAGSNTSISFKETKDKLEAYRPYYITAGGTPQLDGYNLQVKAYKDDGLKQPAGAFRFVGTVDGVDNATAAAANAYILQDDGKFHKVTTEYPEATVPAYRAYITCPKTLGAKQFSVILDGETTGIGDVTNEANDGKNGPVYDLQGRRVADRLDDARHQLPAGVYIVGGRKVIVK